MGLPAAQKLAASLAPADLHYLSEFLDTGMMEWGSPEAHLWETFIAMLFTELPPPYPTSGGPAELCPHLIHYSTSDVLGQNPVYDKQTTVSSMWNTSRNIPSYLMQR